MALIKDDHYDVFSFKPFVFDVILNGFRSGKDDLVILVEFLSMARQDFSSYLDYCSFWDKLLK